MEILTSDQAMFAYYIAITIGVTEVFKRAFKILNRFIPLVSLVVGLGLSFIGGFTTEALLMGLVVGLSASGLFSGAKKLTLG